MDGDALSFDLSTMLPADLQERANKNRAEAAAPATGAAPSLLHPGSPPAGSAAPPVFPSGPVSAPPSTPGPPSAQAPAPPAAAPAEDPPSQHVLRLANDVRTLTYAISYIQDRLADAIESTSHETNARLATKADLDAARAQLQRMADEIGQLRQALATARQQTELHSDQARQAEGRLNSAMQGAHAHIAGLTEQAEAHQAAIAQLRETTAQQRADLEAARRERDAARQRCAELTQAQSWHPRGNLRVVPGE